MDAAARRIAGERLRHARTRLADTDVGLTAAVAGGAHWFHSSRTHRRDHDARGSDRSFSSLATRKATFLLALILIASPVAGLRPMRAARFLT